MATAASPEPLSPSVIGKQSVVSSFRPHSRPRPRTHSATLRTDAGKPLILFHPHIHVPSAEDSLPRSCTG